MMEVKKYIQDNLGSLSNSFPKICFKYGYDNSLKTHIIEVTPAHDFYNNEVLLEAWVDLSLRFMAEFPTEEIVFISSDSTLVLENYELIINECKHEELLAHIVDIFLNQNLSPTFSDINFTLSAKSETGKCYSSNNAHTVNIDKTDFMSNDEFYNPEQFSMAA